jgi:hypothetical protein
MVNANPAIMEYGGQNDFHILKCSRGTCTVPAHLLSVCWTCIAAIKNASNEKQIIFEHRLPNNFSKFPNDIFLRMIHVDFKILWFVITTISLFTEIKYSTAMESTVENPDVDTDYGQHMLVTQSDKRSASVSFSAAQFERGEEELDENILAPTVAPYTLKPITVLTFVDVTTPSTLPPNIVTGPMFYPTLDFGATASIPGFPKRKFVSDAPSPFPKWSDMPSLSPSDMPSYMPNWSDSPSLIPTLTIDESDMPSLSPSMVPSPIPTSNGILSIPTKRQNPFLTENNIKLEEGKSDGIQTEDNGEKQGCIKINLRCFSADDCCWKNVCFENVCTKPRDVPEGYVEDDGNRYRQLEKKIQYTK